MLVSARFFNRLMIKMTMRFKRCFPRENDAHQNVRSISGRQTFCIGWAPISNNSFFWPRQNSAPPNEQARPIRLTKRFPCSWGAKRGLLRKPASSLHAAAARLRAALQWAAAYSNYFPVDPSAVACPGSPGRTGARQIRKTMRRSPGEARRGEARPRSRETAGPRRARATLGKKPALPLTPTGPCRAPRRARSRRPPCPWAWWDKR